MRWFVIIAGFFLLAFLVFDPLPDENRAGTVPASKHSRKVVKTRKPQLSALFEENGLAWGSPIFVRIFKATGNLELWVKDGDRFRLFKNYRICYFSGGLGPKRRNGDLQGPEGFYYVPPRAMNPYSSYHLSIDIGYPNTYDSVRGRTGDNIMIHGDCASAGCFAMTDAGIEEIWTLARAAFEKGQPFFRVHIFPFRMIDENIGLFEGTERHEFWSNLKNGYDYFEQYKLPPDMHVLNRKYVIR